MRRTLAALLGAAGLLVTGLASSPPAHAASVDLVAFFTPMHLRGSEGSLTDTLHIIATVFDLILMLAVMVFGAVAGGKWFRLYTYATLLLFVATGAWSLMDGFRIAANLPTPWLGVRERITIYGYMLWMVVLALELWRARATKAAGNLLASAPVQRTAQ